MSSVETEISDTMQAVVCHAPENYTLEEVPVPQPGPGEALVQVEAVGICASDLKCYHGAAKFWGDQNRPAWAETEVIPGHEFVGKIVKLDDEAAERWGVAVGDRVTSEQIVPCWKCRYCVRGQYHMCGPHDLYGFKRRTPGAMASYMIYSADALVHKISPDLPPAHAAFVEPLSCALHAVERANLTFDDVVVVAGCGPIGLGMIAGARAKYPAKIVALDMAPDKLKLALTNFSGNFQNWWLVLTPLGAMFATLLLVTFIGESIREAFDPKGCGCIPSGQSPAYKSGDLD